MDQLDAIMDEFEQTEQAYYDAVNDLRRLNRNDPMYNINAEQVEIIYGELIRLAVQGQQLQNRLARGDSGFGYDWDIVPPRAHSRGSDYGG